MNLARLNYMNFLVLLITTFLLSGFQTTFWFQIFGSLPAPLLWLNMVLYLILYRRQTEGILTIYALAFAINPFTAMPIGILWLNALILFVVMHFIKKRVFSPGPRYFIQASFGIAIAYHVSYFSLSQFFEGNPATVSFFGRSFEILFTGLTAAPMFWLMSNIDKWTNKEILPESGGAEA